MKRNVTIFLSAFFLLFTINGVFAQRGTAASSVVEVRLASPLPRNSDWGRQLDRLAGEWARVTGNQVVLRVIHDGLEGSEGRMLSSLNANNIQAALFISTGLSDICPPAMTLSAPFLIRNNNELDAVLPEVLPVLDRSMNNSNFVSVGWAKGGWVYFFSREPVRTPDDLRRQRLGTSEGLNELNSVFRIMGFHAVESDMVDIGQKLAANVVNATYLLPEAVAPYGLHRYLTNMLDMPIAPFLGSIIMNRVTWNRISAEHQQAIKTVTERIIKEIEASMIVTSANAVASMQRSGLTVINPTPAQEELWRAETDRAVPMLFGTTFDRSIYNQISDILARVRR